MSKQQTNAADILGEEKAQKQKPREPKLGEKVLFVTNGEGNFTKYVGIVSKVHPSGAVDLAAFRESFIDFRTKVPYSKEDTSGSYQWLEK